MRTFKKALAFMLCGLLVLFSLCSCSGAKNQDTVQSLSDTIKAQLQQDIVWTELAPDKVAAHFGFSGETAEHSAVFINDSEDHFDTVAFFDFKNEDDKNAAIKAISSTLSGSADTFKAVNDSEAEKIVKRLLYSNNNRLCLIITSLPENVTEILTQKGFTPISK